MKIVTERLSLEPISPMLAARIIEREERPGDDWHPEYPLPDELDPLRQLARAAEPDPFFTLYMIRCTVDHLAIGGFGFFGPPDSSGEVRFGYGLVPAARGCGLATEAVAAALAEARNHGALRVAADTDPANVPSQRVLEKAGLVRTHGPDGAVWFARDLST